MSLIICKKFKFNKIANEPSRKEINTYSAYPCLSGNID